jgi:hypothetical protein
VPIRQEPAETALLAALEVTSPEEAESQVQRTDYAEEEVEAATLQDVSEPHLAKLTDAVEADDELRVGAAIEDGIETLQEAASVNDSGEAEQVTNNIAEEDNPAT